jgi:hypothetical protein
VLVRFAAIASASGGVRLVKFDKVDLVAVLIAMAVAILAVAYFLVLRP